MTTLEAIIAELKRQARERGLEWLDVDDPSDATLDGQVDLVALAKAIDDARNTPAIQAP
jgi:hypothetical protein